MRIPRVMGIENEYGLVPAKEMIKEGDNDEEKERVLRKAVSDLLSNPLLKAL